MIKLIIPIEYYRHGGVEKVLISLIQEWIKTIDLVILILPNNKLAHFQAILPPTNKIIYESFSTKPPSLLLKILAKLKLTKLYQKFAQQEKQIFISQTINHLINKYQATHALYILTNRLPVPRLKIPLAMICHDIFWHFSPLTYDANYIQEYDHSLAQWLAKVNLVIAVSQKTKQDLLSLFSQYESKIKVVLNAASIVQHQTPHSHQTEEIIFYYPSSFGIYKDQLILLQAGIKLAKIQLKFKIVFIGKDTDGLINGQLSLSQQSHTQEYKDYITKCHNLYQDHPQIISQHFLGLGYRSESELEQWYAKAHCVVVPSRYEGFGLAVSEAIVRGLPVICSDLDVFREQVNLYQASDRVAFFNPQDLDQLTNSLDQFINHPIPRLSISSIHQRFSHWNWSIVAQEYLNLLSSSKSHNLDC